MFSSHLALSLPSVVTFSDGSTITYLYTADGRKPRTTHVINGTTTTTDYCGNVIYEGTTPKKLLTDEGYVDLTTATPTYYYYLKDHQGNNRVVINATGGDAVEVNHYYPFGGLFSTSTNVQPYKYNGKELDTKKGLNWYDYGARHYDAVLGRWHVVDPLAEKYYRNSSYLYCSNSPLIHIDPSGMDEWDLDEYGNIINHIKTKKHDAFFFVDKEKNRIEDKSIIFDYGTVENQKTESYFVKKESAGSMISGYFDSYQIRGDENATKLFEFLSEATINTKVEWSHVKAGVEGKDGLNFINTSHSKNFEAGISSLWQTQLYDGYTLREINHSHPVMMNASRGDYDFKRNIISYKLKYGLYPIPDFKIYHVPTKQYKKF